MIPLCASVCPRCGRHHHPPSRADLSDGRDVLKSAATAFLSISCFQRPVEQCVKKSRQVLSAGLTPT